MSAMRDSRTWVTWSAMRTRCLNEKTPLYKYYGGRGVTICPEWISFERFVADMGERPKGMSLDRIDNDKGYSKENCRWATDLQQGQNTRRVKKIEYKGEIHCIAEWARIVGIGQPTLAYRVRSGWSTERALTAPSTYGVNHIAAIYIEYEGERHHLAEWERRRGFKKGLLVDRLQRGWTPERALTTPVYTRRKPRTIQ